jgi:iron complex transport system ATP-binding protein
MAEPLLELRDISFVREGRYLIKDVTWTVGSSENWILFGRNGAGKTMLLELITGYLQSSGGRIRRFGKGYGEGSSIRELRRRIGYVSTPLASMIPKNEPLMDVIIGGVDASAGLWRRPLESEVERAMALLEQIGMGSRSRDPFRILSDGERQKILMLRAMINDPDILILDEPSRGLDLTSREEVLSAMQALFEKKRGVSIIYVTHHTDEIVTLFTKIMILSDGKVFYCGDIEEGLESQVLSRVFDRKIEVVKMDGRYYTVVKGDRKGATA